MLGWWGHGLKFVVIFPQFSWAGRCLWVLDKICHAPSVQSQPAAYRHALSASCRLQTAGGFARHESCRGDLHRRLSEVVVREEEGGNDLTSSYLSCRLVLASLHIEEGEV